MFLMNQKSPKAKQFLEFLRNKEKMEIAAFLSDITYHLNDLNLKRYIYITINITEFSIEALKVCPWASAASLQSELIELQKTWHCRNLCVTLQPFGRRWSLQQVSPPCRTLNILTIFPSAYPCESAFSTMTTVKNKYRNTLTNEHLYQCIRLALTPFVPKFKELLAQKKVSSFTLMWTKHIILCA